MARIATMPRSRRPPPNATARIKNVIRGAGDKKAALETARANASIRALDPLATWSFGWLSAIGVVGSLKPRSLANLAASTVLPPTTVERDLAWAVAAIVRQSNDVQAHIAFAQKLESSVLGGTLEDALSIAANAETHTGHSFYYLAHRIALTQLTLGLEAQKELVTGIRESKSTQITRFYAFWWSVRAEDETTAEHFIEGLNARLHAWQVSPQLEAQIRFFLLSQVPLAGMEQNLLASATATSAIDTYETLVALATVVAAEQRPCQALFSLAVKTLRQHLEDPRLTRIGILFEQDEAVSSLLPVPSDLRAFALRGAEPVYEGRVHTPEEFAAAVMLGLEEAAGENEFSRRLYKTLTLSHERSAESNFAAGQLVKLSWMVAPGGLGAWILATASESHPQSPPISSVNQAIRFVAASDGLLTGVSSRPFQPKPALLKIIEAAYDDATGAAARLLAGENVGEESALLNRAVRSELELERAVLTQNPKTTLATAVACQQIRESRLAHYFKVAALLDLGAAKDALQDAVSVLTVKPYALSWLPVEALLAAAYRDDANQFPGLIETPILFSVAATRALPAFASYASYTAEDFLFSNGVDRPSALALDTLDVPEEYLVEFLRRVCTPATMKLFSAFDSERELEEERITICQLLSRRTPELREELEDEARTIVTSRLVTEALKELQASKISIDEDALRQWATRRLREDYVRYQSLNATGLVVVDDSYREALKKALETGFFSDSLYDVPANEASELFTQLVSRLIRECAFNPEHGLDCYLSLRVRHGTMSGMLRGPLEREHVVTRRITEAGDYRTNIHWRQTLGGDPGLPLWDALEERLADFSRSFDALVEELTSEYIQIRREDKPKGLFEMQVSLLSVYGLATDIKPETSFEDFVRSAIKVFWALVEISLARVREFLDVEARRRFRSLFEVLESDVRDELALAPLADAVIRARNELERSLDMVRDWFELPTANAALVFTIEELVTVSMEAIKSFHRDFRPLLNPVQARDLPPLQGLLNLFSDMFFLIFENIYTHCGMADPAISIKCWLQNGFLWVEVINEVSEERSGPNYSAHVEAALARISTGAYLGDVSKEGGTGFPKLAKLIGFNSGDVHLHFRLDGTQKKFVTLFSLRALVFRAEGDRDAGVNS